MSTTKRIEVGLGQRVLDLLVDVIGQVVAIDHADAAGVDQLEEPGIVVLADLDQGPDPVAGDAGGVVDDRDPSDRRAS